MSGVYCSFRTGFDKGSKMFVRKGPKCDRSLCKPLSKPESLQAVSGERRQLDCFGHYRHPHY